MFYKVKERGIMSNYITIKEAAKLLKVTGQTLRNWDKADKLKPHRHPINNYRLYKESDLKKLLQKIEQ